MELGGLWHAVVCMFRYFLLLLTIPVFGPLFSAGILILIMCFFLGSRGWVVVWVFFTLYNIVHSSSSASFDNISFNSAAYKSMLRSSNSLHGPSNRSKA